LKSPLQLDDGTMPGEGVWLSVEGIEPYPLCGLDDSCRAGGDNPLFAGCCCGLGVLVVAVCGRGVCVVVVEAAMDGAVDAAEEVLLMVFALLGS
jgi:hypothetical protein